LSPISETKIKVKAAVNPDFARASFIMEGPPFRQTITAKATALTASTPAIESGYRIPEIGDNLTNIPRAICQKNSMKQTKVKCHSNCKRSILHYLNIEGLTLAKDCNQTIRQIKGKEKVLTD
jgi:hypothetical protein